MNKLIEKIIKEDTFISDSKLILKFSLEDIAETKEYWLTKIKKFYNDQKEKAFIIDEYIYMYQWYCFLYAYKLIKSIRSQKEKEAVLEEYLAPIKRWLKRDDTNSFVKENKIFSFEELDKAVFIGSIWGEFQEDSKAPWKRPDVYKNMPFNCKLGLWLYNAINKWATVE